MSDTKLYQADVLDWARDYDGEKFHALLCDPPYELAFMGKKWDSSGVSFRSETWAALAEHLHPGAFGMAFAGSRTMHRIACAIEDAGLILHPFIGWVYGSGFPKATRIDTQIDKAAGAEREVVEVGRAGKNALGQDSGWNKTYNPDQFNITAPATPLAATWQGHRYGLQALKPALEPIIIFQKRYVGKPFECICETGAGALNIDGGRIGTDGETPKGSGNRDGTGNTYRLKYWVSSNGGNVTPPAGRWPSNFILDEDAAEVLGAQSGVSKSNTRGSTGKPLFATSGRSMIWNANSVIDTTDRGHNDTGTAARFFYQVNYQLEQADPFIYQAKAARKERDAGLEGREAEHVRQLSGGEFSHNSGSSNSSKNGATVRNPHPTVKPLKLTQYLATLLLPPAEYAPRRILCPFAGSGSEMIGAGLAGWEHITGIELGAENVEIAEARLAHWLAGLPLFAERDA